MRTAHGTEVCGFGAFARQSFIVKFARSFRIEREIELIFPAELTRLCPQTSLATSRA
jgi:hypothetical protein